MKFQFLIFPLGNQTAVVSAKIQTLEIGFKGFLSERIHASIYKCIDLSTARKVKNQLYKLNRGKTDNSKILESINNESPLSLLLLQWRLEYQIS